MNISDNTVTDRTRRIDELGVVAERGWAVADEELEVGMVAVAVPVRDHTGGIIAALTVAAFLCRVALAWASGTLAAIDWQGEVQLVGEAIAAAFMAAGGYALVNNNKPALPPPRHRPPAPDAPGWSRSAT